MDTPDPGSYEVEIRVIGWLDFKRIVPGIKFPAIPARTEQFAEFVRWKHENNLFPSIRAGMTGPSMIHQGYTLADISKIEQWLESKGFHPQYLVDDDEKDWCFNEDDQWVDHDPLNPCRVPPGYDLLPLDTAVVVGDILWHPAWTKWLPVTEPVASVRILNCPVARKHGTQNDA